jgi:hypothetical protein
MEMLTAMQNDCQRSGRVYSLTQMLEKVTTGNILCHSTGHYRLQPGGDPLPVLIPLNCVPPPRARTIFETGACVNEDDPHPFNEL